MNDPLAGRCGTCARFVRVTESIDENGEVHRAGECLLGVWPSPLYDTNTCSQYVARGTFTAKPTRPAPSQGPQARSRAASWGPTPQTVRATHHFTLPEELLDMNADEFRAVLRQVIRDELGVATVQIGARWHGGELVMTPGKEGTADKRIPIETFFHKIVMIRDKLRVLEQKVNSAKGLTDEDKVQMQQYITQCYGSLTTFNILFADKNDGFVGQKGDD
jgi:hypothetical protein